MLGPTWLSFYDLLIRFHTSASASATFVPAAVAISFTLSQTPFPPVSDDPPTASAVGAGNIEANSSCLARCCGEGSAANGF